MRESALSYVYVSNATDGEVGAYRLHADGRLQPGARARVAPAVGPLAVSPDRRFLYAAVRAQPYSVHVHAIDPASGALTPQSVASLPASCPYISLDRTGRTLFFASYASHLVGVHALGADGCLAPKPPQLIPVGRSAHSIRADASNRFVYVPTLGSDQVFQFTFDAKSGRLCSNTPAAAQMLAGTGPRHFVTSADNKFLYVLSELLGTVSTFALDEDTGLLAEIGSASGLPPGTRLVPGTPRAAVGAPAGTMDAAPARNRDHDIWAADIHLRPDGKFLYISERTSSTLAAFSVHAASGKLNYLASTPTERQPRGFAISPDGRFLIACGEKSDTISVHAIGEAGGALSPPRKYPGGKGANWVEVVGVDG